MAIQVDDNCCSGRIPQPTVYSTITSGNVKGSIYHLKNNSCNAQEDDPGENQPLLGINSHLNNSTPIKSAEIEELQIEDKFHKRKRWRSIFIMYFTMFLTALTFSIVISSIWPYLLQVDSDNATPKFLGWVVASYSLGQLIASPLFGLWADYRPAMEPLVTSMIINIIFNLLYTYCGAFNAGMAGLVMIVARSLTGFGAGIGGVARSYVSEATTLKERIGAMASIGAAQALGFIVGPVLGLAFVPLGGDGVSVHAVRFNLNMYTGPGYVGAVLGILNLFLIVLFFREYKLVDRDTRKKLREEETKKKKAEQLRKKWMKESHLSGFAREAARKHYDRIAAGASVVIFFVILSSFSVFEVLLSPLTMDEFAWSQSQAVLYNNAFFAGLSVITIITLISVKYITRRVDERVVLMVGMFFLAFTFFVLIPMSNEPPQVISISTLTASSRPNSSNFPMISLVDSNQTLPALGCRDPPQLWCSHVPKIYFIQLFLSLVLITLGYAMSSVTIFSIYSKILGPFPQGVMMGVLTSAGSLARAIGPMGIGFLYQHYGPLVTFTSMVGLIVGTIIFVLVISLRLVPYARYVDKTNPLVVQ